jgi:uncharacterized protein (TIGR02145 family)
MKNNSFVIVMLFIAFGVVSQGQTFDLTFTGIDSASYARLDSIKVMNRTQGNETVIYWPDTSITVTIDPGDLLLYIGYTTYSPVGTSEINAGDRSFELFQNRPNPVKEQGVIPLYVPRRGPVEMMLSSVSGRILFSSAFLLDEGHHTFRFTAGEGGLFFLTARFEGKTRSIKIMSASSGKPGNCLLEYAGSNRHPVPFKESADHGGAIVLASGIPDYPQENGTYVFQFATNIPCPGIPTVEYEGQVYNTIQVFSQCWISENLNAGVMIPGDQEQADNGLIEKYCIDNMPDSCTKYGGLYQWTEAMQYTSLQGAQGICPPGWHLPTDEEWRVLEGAVDSEFGIGYPEWDSLGLRGYDAGANLKAISSWSQGGNGTDLYGYSGLPGGSRYLGGGFGENSEFGFLWSSTELDDEYAFYRRLDYVHTGTVRHNYNKPGGFSVRCLKD